jgi:hypothetical protein
VQTDARTKTVSLVIRRATQTDISDVRNASRRLRCPNPTIAADEVSSAFHTSWITDLQLWQSLLTVAIRRADMNKWHRKGWTGSDMWRQVCSSPVRPTLVHMGLIRALVFLNVRIGVLCFVLYWLCHGQNRSNQLVLRSWFCDCPCKGRYRQVHICLGQKCPVITIEWNDQEYTLDRSARWSYYHETQLERQHAWGQAIWSQYLVLKA